MANNRNVLLVIPCFRESGRIRPFLESLCTEAEALGDVQIMVVEDGGGAEEKQRMDELIAPYRERHSFMRPVHHLEQNVGKGGAIYAGWSTEKEARWLAFADADGSCSAKEVARMIRMAREEEALERAYYAARIHMLGRTVHRLWYRHVMGRVYATLVEWLLHTPAYDTQCGLKLAPRLAFEKVHPRLTLLGFAFDVELMVALQCSGTEIVEVPIDWHETPGGKLNLISEPWRMLRDVLQVRARRKAGFYSNSGNRD